MDEMIRYCPDCRRDRIFAQLHPRDGECPDSAGGCPEWLCAECGAGLLIGLASFLPEPAPALAHRRVA